MECTEKQVPSGPWDKATACKAPSPGSCSKDTLLFKIPTCGCLNPFSTPKSSQQDLQMAVAKPFHGLTAGRGKCLPSEAQPGLPGTQPPPLALLQGGHYLPWQEKARPSERKGKTGLEPAGPSLAYRSPQMVALQSINLDAHCALTQIKLLAVYPML